MELLCSLCLKNERKKETVQNCSQMLAYFWILKSTQHLSSQLQIHFIIKLFFPARWTRAAATRTSTWANQAPPRLGRGRGRDARGGWRRTSRIRCATRFEFVSPDLYVWKCGLPSKFESKKLLNETLLPSVLWNNPPPKENNVSNYKVFFPCKITFSKFFNQGSAMMWIAVVDSLLIVS